MLILENFEFYRRSSATGPTKHFFILLAGQQFLNSLKLNFKFCFQERQRASFLIKNLQKRLVFGLHYCTLCPSFRPSFFLEIVFELYHLFFLNFGMVLETHMKLCVTEPDFPEKCFWPPKLGKWTKNGPKQGFLNLLKYMVIKFLLNLFND